MRSPNSSLGRLACIYPVGLVSRSSHQPIILWPLQATRRAPPVGGLEDVYRGQLAVPSPIRPGQNSGNRQRPKKVLVTTSPKLTRSFVSRRSLLGALATSAVSLPIVSACAPPGGTTTQAPSTPSGTGTAAPEGVPTTLPTEDVKLSLYLEQAGAGRHESHPGRPL